MKSDYWHIENTASLLTGTIGVPSMSSISYITRAHVGAMVICTRCISIT